MTKRILMALLCGAFLTGCTKSTIVAPELNAENVPGGGVPVAGEIEIDWQQVADDADSFFNDESEYPYGKHMQFFLNEDEKKLALTWVVADDIPEDEALLYASDLACEFNDIVAVQDSSIALSNDNSLGGLYDQYALIVGTFPRERRTTRASGSSTWSWPQARTTRIPQRWPPRRVRRRRQRLRPPQNPRSPSWDRERDSRN